jgi:hypothetical protein
MSHHLHGLHPAPPARLLPPCQPLLLSRREITWQARGHMVRLWLRTLGGVLATAFDCTVLMYIVASCPPIVLSVALLAVLCVPTCGDRPAHPLPLPVVTLLCPLPLSPHVGPLWGRLDYPFSNPCPWFKMLWALFTRVQIPVSAHMCTTWPSTRTGGYYSIVSSYTSSYTCAFAGGVVVLSIRSTRPTRARPRT